MRVRFTITDKSNVITENTDKVVEALQIVPLENEPYRQTYNIQTNNWKPQQQTIISNTTDKQTFEKMTTDNKQGQQTSIQQARRDQERNRQLTNSENIGKLGPRPPL